MGRWLGAKGSATNGTLPTPTPSDRGPHAPSTDVKNRTHTDIVTFDKSYLDFACLLDQSSNDKMREAARSKP